VYLSAYAAVRWQYGQYRLRAVRSVERREISNQARWKEFVIVWPIVKRGLNNSSLFTAKKFARRENTIYSI